MSNEMALIKMHAALTGDFSKLKFRASGVGKLMVGSLGISDEEEAAIKALELEKKTLVNANGNKVKWTDNKEGSLQKLIYKRDHPELSKTAKAFVRESVLSWLMDRRPEIRSKYLEKGIHAEDNSIDLLTEVYGMYFEKNDQRQSNDFFTGTCDIIMPDRIIDVKSSWDLFTFEQAEWKEIYYAQGQVYMEMYDRPLFQLSYCLVDKPEGMFKKEYDQLMMKYGGAGSARADGYEFNEEVRYLVNQSFYGERSEKPIPANERVISYYTERNERYMDELKTRVGYARAYASEYWKERQDRISRKGLIAVYEGQGEPIK